MIVNFNKNVKIALLGLGLENQAMLDFLIKKYGIKNLDISVCDRRSRKEIEKKFTRIKSISSNLSWKSGEKFNSGLEKFDILFRSPGWPINCPGIQKALKNGVLLSSPMNLFFEFCPSKNIIAVSGTKGKGTTSSLIYEIIKNSGKGCFLGGNIGVAPFTFLEKIKKNDWLVLELSSFQLEDLKFKPKIAVFTNLFKEHLSPADPNNPNFHSNLKSYFNAKMKLCSLQDEEDFFVINKKLSKKINDKNVKSKLIYFSKSNLKSNLFGDFNQENIGAAEEVAKILKIKKVDYSKVISSFSNLSHRLELVREKNGIKYFDNSFATTPESTILDLQSFDKNIILIAGGADKGADFSILAKEIKKRVKFLTLFKGPGGERIKRELKKIKYPAEQMVEVDSMKKAVRITNDTAIDGDIVLLSTACASFGLFKNYKERGDLFKKEVELILKKI